MRTPNLSSRITHKHQRPEPRCRESIDSGPEILRGEARHLDRLSDRLHDQASFWLIVGDAGDVVYVAGQGREATSTRRHPGAAEIVRKSDGSIQVSAIKVDQHSRRATDQLSTAVLTEAENPTQLDVVEVAWLVALTDPQQGARQIGPGAFQELQRDDAVALFDD